MPRGRKKNPDRPMETKLSIPESVLARVSLILVDPVTGGRKYGSMSALVTQLLRQWLKEQGVDT